MNTMDAEGATPQPPLRRKPYLTADGTLVIPFDSDPKYHWWKGGQSVKDTLAEIKAAETLTQPGECDHNSSARAG